VLDVPLLPEGCDTSIEDGSVTVGTPRTENLPVALLAVGKSIGFEEVSSSEGILTIGTHTVFRVIDPPDGLDDFPNNGLLALSASSSR